MPEQRYVYRVGTSHVVALPPRVREHLGILAGDSVHWHLVRGKEAVLSTKAQREGGRPEGLALTRQLEATRTELERLRRRVAARPLRVLHEGVGVGVHQAVSSLLPFEDRLRAIEEALEDLRARLPFRRRYARGGTPRAERSAPASHEEAERDPPFADDFDGEGRLIPRGPVEVIELPPAPSDGDPA